MLTYILKRLALMIPTVLGVLTLTFVVIQFVPGGPVETILAEARAGAGGDTASFQARRDVDAKQVEIVYYDDESNAKTSARLTERLITEDKVAFPTSSTTYAELAPKDKVTLKMWKGFKHELHTDPDRDLVFKFMIDWLNSQK